MRAELTTIYTAFDPPDADLIRMVLEAEGIDCVLDNEHQAGLTGTLPIKVQVRSSDAERAREFIRLHEEDEHDE